MSTPRRPAPRRPAGGRHAADRARLLVEIDDRAASGHLVLRVHGELDLSTVDDFTATVCEAGAARGEVDLDLSDLSFCDVIGAAGIEAVQRRLLAGGCRLSLVGTDRSLALLRRAGGLFPGLCTAAATHQVEPSS